MRKYKNLMDNHKEDFRKWCEIDKSMPLFYRYDFYQSLFGDNWEIALVKKGENIVALMPYIITKNKGFKVIRPFPLVSYQGIWLNYPSNQKYTSKISFEKEVITAIIHQLPTVALFRQQFHPKFTNWLPFYWEKYQQTTKYSYIINNITDLAVVFNNFKDKTRNVIKKAQQNFYIESSTIEEFLAFKNQNNIINININIHKITEKIVFYALSRNIGELLVAKNKDGIVCSVVFYVWDTTSAYLLQSINHKNINHSGASSLLIWQAIKNASLKTKSFDFEGGNIPSVETFFRAFGGTQTPYFEISKTIHPLLKLLRY